MARPKEVRIIDVGPRDGLQNEPARIPTDVKIRYVDMLTDHNFLSSLGTFTIFALFIVPLTFVLSLALALLVNQVKIARAFFRSVFALDAPAG